MTRIMLDLESLGNKPGSVIVAIGAVKFDETGILDSFYERVDAQSCVAAGLKMDVSTVLWWMQQEEVARLEITKPGVHLNVALSLFSKWYGDNASVEVWGNGATFDNVLLNDAYNAVQLERPWSYRADRCYRTVKALRPDIPAPKVGTLHNALDDAKLQALHLIEILKTV